MEHGNLSTKLAPIVGIRFENIIYNHGSVNQPGCAISDNLLSKDVNLYFITTLPARKAIAWCYKWGIMYTRVIGVDSVLEIPDLCRAHSVTLYIDTDDRVLEAVGMTPKTKAQKWEQKLETMQQM